MKIWIFNNYNMLPAHGHLIRHYNFGSWLKKKGHDPVVFVGSHPHNTDIQLIEGADAFREFQSTPFSWILVKTMKYGMSRKKQVFTMFQFYWNGKKAAKYAAEQYGKPDVVLGSSAHPLTAVLALKLGKKYGCPAIVEIRDLWPESIVAYGIAESRNPAILALRQLEKWIYKKTDALIFTQEGAYDYIVEQGWENEIPRDKVFYINNGIDLESFYYNRDQYQINDLDLKDSDSIKIIYTGSIRKVNNLGVLLEAAKYTDNSRIKFLIWGSGDQLPILQKRVQDEGLKNVIFKGNVEKKYIPFIVSQADYNYINGADNDIFRFGISPNKLFDYFAAEKPVLMLIRAKYNPAERLSCGLICQTEEEFLKLLSNLPSPSAEQYKTLCQNAKAAAKEYDFKNLTQKLLNVIERLEKK